MNAISEESLLIIEHWDTVEDILNAIKQLDKEVTALLHSIETKLTKSNWWENGWEFIQYRNSQVYISNRRWGGNNRYAIWIGVENFTTANLLSTKTAPQLYVWIPKRHIDLSQALATELEEIEDKIIGEIDTRSNGYVIRQDVRQCLPGEAGQCFSNAIQQCIDFFTHYADMLSKFDETIKTYLTDQ